MKTILRLFAVLSVVAAATPTRAHSSDHAYPAHARDFQSVGAGVLQADEANALCFGVGTDSHDTATGGPSGGLIDKN